MSGHTPFPWLLAEDGTTIYSGSMHTGVASTAPDPMCREHYTGGPGGGVHFSPSPDLEERKANALVIFLSVTGYEELAKAAFDLVEELDLQCLAPNAQLPDQGCVCRVCVLRVPLFGGAGVSAVILLHPAMTGQEAHAWCTRFGAQLQVEHRQGKLHLLVVASPRPDPVFPLLFTCEACGWQGQHPGWANTLDHFSPPIGEVPVCPKCDAPYPSFVNTLESTAPCP